MEDLNLINWEVQENPCITCPFAGTAPIQLDESSYQAYLEKLLNFESQHLCHSAGNQKICRGGRDLQLRILCLRGLIPSPTDEAFCQATKEALAQIKGEAMSGLTDKEKLEQWLQNNQKYFAIFSTTAIEHSDYFVLSPSVAAQGLARHPWDNDCAEIEDFEETQEGCVFAIGNEMFEFYYKEPPSDRWGNTATVDGGIELLPGFFAVFYQDDEWSEEHFPTQWGIEDPQMFVEFVQKNQPEIIADIYEKIDCNGCANTWQFFTTNIPFDSPIWEELRDKFKKLENRENLKDNLVSAIWLQAMCPDAATEIQFWLDKVNKELRYTAPGDRETDCNIALFISQKEASSNPSLVSVLDATVLNPDCPIGSINEWFSNGNNSESLMLENHCYWQQICRIKENLVIEL